MDDHPHTCLSRAIWLMCDINLKLRIYVFLCLSSFARRLLNMGVIQSLCRLAEIVCWLGEYIGVLLFLCDRREDNAFLFPFFYYHYLFEGGIFSDVIFSTRIVLTTILERKRADMASDVHHASIYVYIMAQRKQESSARFSLVRLHMTASWVSRRGIRRRAVGFIRLTSSV